MPLDKSVKISELVKETEGFTGADIEALVREAGISALRKDIKAKNVRKEDFEKALEEVKPSLTPQIKKFYDEMLDRLKYNAISEKKKKTKEDDDTRYLG